MNTLFQVAGRLVVRACGLIVLLAGLWMVLKAVHEALVLYEDPSRIEILADHMERATNLDRSILSLQPKRGGKTAARPPAEAKPAGADPRPVTGTTPPRTGLRLSYFIAWIVELLLLLLIARVGLAALKTGGELVLHEAKKSEPEKDTVPYPAPQRSYRS